MRTPRIFLAVTVGLALCLGGCSYYKTVTDAFSSLSQAKVSPKAIIIAANTFNALEATATNYIEQKRCDGKNGPFCRNPSAMAVIVPAIRSGRGARDELIAFMKAHPGQLGPQGTFDALTSANTVLQKTFDLYRVNG